MSPKVVLTCAPLLRKGALRNAFRPPPPSAARAGGIETRLFTREYTMHKKALTVAIAGALAAPMAAQAVDFTVSGHINRALFITDSDSSTSATVKDNGSSGTRIRFTGSSEMMDGGSAGVNLEYAAAVHSSGRHVTLRYAEVYYSGEFGKFAIGQGDQGGEGSVYSDKSGTFGIGHGQDTGQASAAVTAYYSSLDGGSGRNERIRYDTPSIGPVSAAFSVGNGDQVSAGVRISQSFGGTAFGAKIGTVQMPGDNGTISASAGVKLDSGVTVSGAWGSQEVGGNASDPSFFQATVGYVMGDTSVAASWYASSDLVNDGSEGTVIGLGANHNLPKVGAQVYVALQNYAAEDMVAGIDTDETVAVIGTRIKF